MMSQHLRVEEVMLLIRFAFKNRTMSISETLNLVEHINIIITSIIIIKTIIIAII